MTESLTLGIRLNDALIRCITIDPLYDKIHDQDVFVRTNECLQHLPKLFTVHLDSRLSLKST